MNIHSSAGWNGITKADLEELCAQLHGRCPVCGEVFCSPDCESVLRARDQPRQIWWRCEGAD